MRPASFVIVAVAGATLVAALLLIPRENERLAMAMRDDRLGAAHEILRMQAVETMSASDLKERIRLAEIAGDTADAEHAAQEYIRRHPSDETVLDALANLYRATQQGEAYLATRLALYRRFPDRLRFHDVVGRYRLTGDIQAELDAAEQALKYGLMDERDLARTGLLYAATQRFDKALEALSRVPPQRFDEFRQALLTRVALLIRLDRAEEAVEVAGMIGRFTPSAAEPLQLVFQRAGASIVQTD